MQISRSSVRRLAGLGILAAAVVASLPVRGADKRIVLIAGKPSHPTWRARVSRRVSADAESPDRFSRDFSAGLRRRLAVEDGGRHACGRQWRPRQRRCSADLRRWRPREPRDPGRPHEGHRCSCGEGRRPRVRSLRRRGTCRSAGRGDAPLDRWLLRGSLLGESDVEAAVRQVPQPSDRAWSRARSPRTTSGISACAGQPIPRSRSASRQSS